MARAHGGHLTAGADDPRYPRAQPGYIDTAMRLKDFTHAPPVQVRLQAVRQESGLGRALERAPPAAIAFGCLLLVGLLAVLDYLSGEQLSLALVYLVPIGIAAWYGAHWTGFLVATAAGLAWVVNELTGLHLGHVFIFYWNSLVRVTLFLVMAYLLSSLRRQLLAVTLQASTDPLTGLFNRRYLYDRIGAEIQRAQRYRHPLTLVCIDVDDFKEINDRHGHVFGDAVLRRVGEVLHGHVRQTDIPARIGGDEFAVLLIETAADAGREAAEKLQHALRYRMADLGSVVTFSIGAVTFLEPPHDIDELFRLADEQLYRAKQRGKDQFAISVADAPALVEQAG
jgi:diguanylate cyclase (GGDEF)-like protein